jgi:hypothetical protein
MQSVAVTTNVVSSNPTHGEVYLILHVRDKVYQLLAALGRWFSPGTPVSSINKTDHHNIPVTVILLKVVLNTITLTLN